jgi:hypothetical protein
MRMPAILAVAMLLLTAGCTSPTFYWYHPDHTLDEAKADFTQCFDHAHRQAGDLITEQHYDRLPPPDGPSAMSGAPQDRGRTAADPTETQEVWRQRYEQSVLAGCMKDKGYMRLRPDRIPSGVRTQDFDENGVAGR